MASEIPPGLPVFFWVRVNPGLAGFVAPAANMKPVSRRSDPGAGVGQVDAAGDVFGLVCCVNLPGLRP